MGTATIGDWLDERERKGVRDPSFLIPGRVASSVTLFSGVANSGKTTTARYVSRSVRTGEPFLGVEPARLGRTYVVWADVGLADEWADWARDTDQGWARDGVILEDRPAQLVKEPEYWSSDALINSLKEREVALVILDPLRGLANGVSLSEDAGVGTVLAPFQRLIHSFPTLIIAHSRKGGGDAQGNEGISGLARVRWEFRGRETRPGTRTVDILPNSAAPMTIKIDVRPSGVRLVSEVDAPAGEATASGDLADRDDELHLRRAEFVIGLGPTTQRAAGEALAQAFGLNPTSGGTTVARLQNLGWLAGSKGRGAAYRPGWKLEEGCSGPATQ
ncbi:MAG: AAA family ATPase [Candidatus Nanopelagicales bacterium]